MLIVDLMHKFELSVWKAIFIYLLRILDCQDEVLKYGLDRWYALFTQCQGAGILMTYIRF